MSCRHDIQCVEVSDVTKNVVSKRHSMRGGEGRGKDCRFNTTSNAWRDWTRQRLSCRHDNPCVVSWDVTKIVVSARQSPHNLSHPAYLATIICKKAPTSCVAQVVALPSPKSDFSYNLYKNLQNEPKLCVKHTLTHPITPKPPLYLQFWEPVPRNWVDANSGTRLASQI